MLYLPSSPYDKIYNLPAFYFVPLTTHALNLPVLKVDAQGHASWLAVPLFTAQLYSIYPCITGSSWHQ